MSYYLSCYKLKGGIILRVKEDVRQAPALNIRTGNASYFDGGLLQFIGWSILGWLITVLTLGICAPWAITMIYGWQVNHTIIDGRRLQFNGSAIGLFGHWIKWLVLIVITLGIYGFWVFIKLEDWKTRNTTFAQ